MINKLFNNKILIMACFFFLFFCGHLLAGEDTAMLKAMIGTVEYFSKGAAGWQTAAEGLTLSSGDKVKTGADGMVSITFANGGEIFLKPNTEFEITSLSRSEDKSSIDYKLQLNMGKLRAMVEKLDPNSSFEVKTPTAVAAIRGTVYYLTVREAQESEIPADIKERLTTDLFVESGGVLYTSIVSGKYFVVNASQASTTHEDGSITVPIDVPPDRQLEWTEEWEILSAEPYESSEDKDITDLFSNDKSGEGDERFGDRVNQVVAAAIELYDERNVILQEMSARLLEKDMERAYLRNEIREILEENDLRQIDACIEKISDAQTGKVMRDIHGNRVRVEQYILRPSSDTVELLNVNLRAGNDLTTMEWITRFNKSLDALPMGQLKTLPWNSYLETKKILGMPYIVSPHQLWGIYPEYMSVGFSHADDAFSESRNFASRFFGTQAIYNQELWVKNFNDNSKMDYRAPIFGYQLPGTYSIASGKRNANDEDGGGSQDNPMGFQYNFASRHDTGSISATFYVISDASIRQDDYNTLRIDNIWDALRVNMVGSNKQIGDNNNLEMIFGSEKLFDKPIDIIYVPAMRMNWKGEELY